MLNKLLLLIIGDIVVQFDWTFRQTSDTAWLEVIKLFLNAVLSCILFGKTNSKWSFECIFSLSLLRELDIRILFQYFLFLNFGWVHDEMVRGPEHWP